MNFGWSVQRARTRQHVRVSAIERLRISATHVVAHVCIHDDNSIAACELQAVQVGAPWAQRARL